MPEPLWRVVVERSMIREFRMVPAATSEEAEEMALEQAAIEDTCDFEQGGDRVVICDLTMGRDDA